MVTLNKIYTKTGDKGETALGDGTRVKKFSERIEACGAVDELNTFVGSARHGVDQDDIQDILARIQNELFDCGADLCVPLHEAEETGQKLRITAEQVRQLEQDIDFHNKDLAPLRSFILPGGSEAASRLHIARAAARRAERITCALAEKEPLNPELIRYLNRLSDLFFVLCRFVNDKGATDILWKPAATQTPKDAG